MQASMDYGKAFTFPQLDADWIKKWAIAGGLSLIPIIGPIMVMGYALEITRRVITDNPQLLPEAEFTSGTRGPAAMSTEGPAEQSYKGSLILADPSLRESTFFRCVLLLTEHSRQTGAFGYILKRPIGKKVGEKLEGDLRVSR